MLKHLLRSLLLFSVVAVTPTARANVVVFSDIFSAISQSRFLWDPPLPLNWTIENGGSVNVLGQCGGQVFDNIPDFQTGVDNCYIDLDGNTQPFDPDNAILPGLLTRRLDLVQNHVYKASFDLAGNQINPFIDTVSVNFGSTSEDFQINGFDDFATYELFFTPTASGPYLLSFQNSNIDAHGALLDNVVVTDTSAPAPLPLLGAGAAMAYQRRLRLLRQKLHGHRR